MTTPSSPTLQITDDGSPTLIHPVTGESYHSLHGALCEARHVYLEAGALFFLKETPASFLRILEIGFGSGLNSLLTFHELSRKNCAFRYITLEPFPVSVACAEAYRSVLMSQGDLLGYEALFLSLHTTSMQETLVVPFSESDVAGMTFCKRSCTLADFSCDEAVDVIYMDAFSPTTQPDLWSDEMLQKLAGFLSPGGCLVTYCAKGAVRRGLVAAGLHVERLPGPPGKREMLRARKPLLLPKCL